MGLKIRDNLDRVPPLITGNFKVEINTNSQLKNTNVVNKLWTMVMDKVMDAIDYAMGESIADDECPKGCRFAYGLKLILCVMSRLNS